MFQSPGSQAPTTRQKAVASLTKKSRAKLEAADGLNMDIRSKEQAIMYLTAKEYLIPGKPTDLQILSHVLLLAMRKVTALIPSVTGFSKLLVIPNCNNKVANCLSRYYESDTHADMHDTHKYILADAHINPSGKDLLPAWYHKVTSNIVEICSLQDHECRGSKHLQEAQRNQDIEAQIMRGWHPGDG